MEKNKKKIVIISVAVILVVAVAVAAAVILTKPEKNLYQDTYVEVTDKNGDIVFDENGDVVTELVTNKEPSSVSDASKTSSTTKGSANSSAPSDTTQATTNANNNNTSSTATTKPTTESTTKKPEKRTVSLEIKVPFYNNMGTKLIVVYSVDGKPMEKLDLSKCKITVNEGTFNKAEDIKLGEIVLESGLITIELPEKIKGDVSFAVDFLDVKLQGNNVTIPASDEVGRIKPATGIEALDGEFD